MWSCVSPSMDDEEAVKFYLFTSQDSAKGTLLKSVKSIEYDINRNYPVKILCHGWVDDDKSYWYAPTVAEYLKRGGVNVIIVHWGKYAKALYSTSVKSVRMVGYFIALLIAQVSEKYEIPHEKFHVIGHSLGSHIAGFAGKNILLRQGVKIGRITGLDPAGPSFYGNQPENRLSYNDARFVDVIHTDAGVAGYKDSLGHTDFYPNGGVRKQNGCRSIDLACSHKRAPLYFAESINSKAFVAVACSSHQEFLDKKFDNGEIAVMGEHVNTKLKGEFYLNTNAQSPFATGSIF